MEPDELAVVWRALADPARRRILDLLRERPRTTGELAEAFETTRFAVMKHLAVLVEAELVVARREGRQRWNHLNAVPLRRVYERWISRYEDHAATALLRLKERLEPSPAETSEVAVTEPPTAAFERFAAELARHVAQLTGEPVEFEPRLGGRLTAGERLLALVTEWSPGERLELRGPLGLPAPWLASWTVAFAGEGEGCRLSITGTSALEADEQAAFAAAWRAVSERFARGGGRGGKGER